MENDKGKLIYERKSRRPGQPTWIRIYSREIDNDYPDYIKKFHRTQFIEIQHAMQCPKCSSIYRGFAEAALAIPDQIEMWKAVFRVIVLPEEKARKIQILKNLAAELEQMPLISEED